MNIPQIYKIFSTQNATGVSLISFSMFAIMEIPWIIYGIIHKAKPIVITYTLWLITNLVIVAGILMYG